MFDSLFSSLVEVKSGIVRSGRYLHCARAHRLGRKKEQVVINRQRTGSAQLPADSIRHDITSSIVTRQPRMRKSPFDFQ